MSSLDRQAEALFNTSVNKVIVAIESISHHEWITIFIGCIECAANKYAIIALNSQDQ